MAMRFVRLISGSRGDLPEGSAPAPDDLHFYRERRGEKIAAVDESSGALLGTIGIYPGRDEGGRFFHLVGIGVQPGDKAEGLESALLEEAGRFMRERKVARLKFGTSPLLTIDAELYITRFGTRYRWRGGVRTPDGKPWPHVSCECDFDDPLARPLDMRDDEVIGRSVIDWEGRQPRLPPRVVYSGPLAVLLPEMTSETLAEAGERDPQFLPVLSSVFHALFIHGYDFSWFDRLPQPASPPGGPWFYYIMKPIIAL